MIVSCLYCEAEFDVSELLSDTTYDDDGAPHEDDETCPYCELHGCLTGIVEDDEDTDNGQCQDD